MSCAALLQGGLLDAQNYMAPVPTLPGLVLLAVGGVGLVALSTDTLFVSVRAPLLAGLPLLAMYLAVALTLRDGAPWWAFPLPAAGWLLILAADQRDRIRRWGGLATTTRVRGLSTGARRTGLVAIALASIIAVILPMRGSMPWDSGGGSGHRRGDGQRPRHPRPARVHAAQPHPGKRHRGAHLRDAGREPLLPPGQRARDVRRRDVARA